MYRVTALIIVLGVFWLSNGLASHIQYVDLADVNNAAISYDITADDAWSWTFDLTTDSMPLWELTTPTSSTGGTTPDTSTADYFGSFDPAEDLHYAYLRIDPNNVSGTPLSEFLRLEVNGIEISTWNNPVILFDWGVPGGSVYDPFGMIASGYSITVTLTGLETLGNDFVMLENVNLEGCFDSATEVPEPATMLLFGTGLLGLLRLRKEKS